MSILFAFPSSLTFFFFHILFGVENFLSGQLILPVKLFSDNTVSYWCPVDIQMSAKFIKWKTLWTFWDANSCLKLPVFDDRVSRERSFIWLVLNDLTSNLSTSNASKLYYRSNLYSLFYVISTFWFLLLSWWLVRSFLLSIFCHLFRSCMCFSLYLFD